MANSPNIPSNINLFQRSYYTRKSARYLGTSDPITIKKHLKPKRKQVKQPEEEE